MIEDFTEARFRTVMDELGVDLDFAAFAKLVRSVPYADPKYTANSLYLLAHEALHGPHGYAWEYGPGKTMLLARDGDRFVIGMMTNTNAKRPFPPWGWKIERWSRDPAKNREKVAAWAKTETRHVVVGKLVRPPPRVEEDGGDGAALLASVVANPDDAAARLVYADWLLERGDARGDLIRLHQEGKDTIDLHRKHAVVVLAPYAAFDAGTTIRTGFVEELVAYAGKLAKQPDVFAREPFRKLHLVVMKPDELAKLAAACAPQLARITELHLEARKSVSHLFSVPTRPAVIAPHLTGLTKLRVERLDETLPEWRKFLTGLRGPIAELTIDAVRRAVFDVLDDPAVLPALRHLEIGYQDWAYERGTRPAVSLAKLLARRNLSSVSISSWHPGGDAMVQVVEALLEAPRTQITIDNCTMDDDATAAIERHARVTIARR